MSREWKWDTNSAEVNRLGNHNEWLIVSDAAYFAALFIGGFVFFYILPQLVKKLKKTKNSSNTKKR